MKKEEEKEGENEKGRVRVDGTSVVGQMALPRVWGRAKDGVLPRPRRGAG